MNVYALQTARNGSKSVPNKNTLVYNGMKLFEYNYAAILHGLREIEKIEMVNVDILVILLGNNRGAYIQDLETAINCVINEEIDSCISVSEYNMFNPYRAYKEDNGLLNTYIDQDEIEKQQTNSHKNDKDAFGNAYFFNGSFWVCRRQAIIDNTGLLPFSWLGRKIKPLVQDSSVMELDDKWQVPVI